MQRTMTSSLLTGRGTSVTTSCPAGDDVLWLHARAEDGTECSTIATWSSDRLRWVLTDDSDHPTLHDAMRHLAAGVEARPEVNR